MEGESNIYGSEFAEAVINNPGGAKRTIRFETGRLAKQAAGAGPAATPEDRVPECRVRRVGRHRSSCDEGEHPDGHSPVVRD